MRRRSEDEQAVAAVIQARVAHSISKKLHLEGPGSEALGAWFLGPKAENADLLLDLIADSVKAHVDSRKRYYPNDPEWITAQRKSSPAYQQATAQLSAELTKVLETLDASVPFYSYRYQGHMLWDVTLPAVLGYFASLLYNQNNVAAEASPVTTWLEMLVGDDLCRMLGYYVPKRKCDGSYEDPAPGETVAWGHVTCGGTVANCESIWAARNAKYLPLGVAAALTNEQALAPARDLEVKLPTGESRPLVGLDPWTLLNIEADVALSLSEAIKAKVDKAVDVSGILERYTLQHLGLVSFLHKYAPYVEPPVFLMPATAHYSWPKGASLVGLGRHSAIPVPTDLDCRLDMGALRVELERCFQERKPVLMVVVVLGTTEQSAVDPLHEVLALREEYRKKGFDFWVHVDAAWGGYFASLLRPAENAKGRLKSCTTRAAFAPELANELVFDPHMVMSHYVTAQYEELGRADSITVDPHKAGYAPYPAGGLCYRNGAMRHLVAFTSPVIHHGEVEPTIGIYGIEGSKPGAAATAVYLSHRVVRPDQSGYGRILGRCLWNSKRVYCALVTMERQDDPFVVAALQRLPSERAGSSADVAAEKQLLRDEIVGRDNPELMEWLTQEGKLDWFRNLGSDQVIVSYAFNFKTANGLNTDLKRMNELNDALFKKMSVVAHAEDLPDVPLFVTSSKLDATTHGSALLSDFKRRLGIVDATEGPVSFLISTVMNPWLSDTADGDQTSRIVDLLRDQVTALIAEHPNFR